MKYTSIALTCWVAQTNAFSNISSRTVPKARTVRIPSSRYSTSQNDLGKSRLLDDVDGIGELTQTVNNDSSPAAMGIENSMVVENLEVPDASLVVNQIIDGNAAIDLSFEELQDLEKIEEANSVLDKEEEIEAPPLSKIIKFAIPAIGVWLCSPLLSLIDTSSVGLLSGTIQQAALNPAVAVTDYTALLVAFMYTATTNLVAASIESEKSVESKSNTKKTLIQSLQLSGFVGLGLGSILSLCAPLLLKAIIGNDTIDPAVFSAALKYVRIRALGFPAATIIGSAQSACLGMQDIKSPMYVLLAAAVVNFFGDMLFVPNTNAWIGGAAGAAWATVFSQYAALGLFLKWLRYRKKEKEDTVNLTQAILELTSKSDEGKPRRKEFKKTLRELSEGEPAVEDTSSEAMPNKTRNMRIKNFFKRSNRENKKEEEFTTRGFLAGELRKRDLVKFPPKQDAKEFWPYVIPVTTTSVGRVSAYVAMSHVVSSSLGTLTMAAQQVIVSIFYCLCPFADSLNLTAQSFVPRIFAKKNSKARSAALRKTTLNFMKAAALSGLSLVGIAATIPFYNHLFTSDPAVIAQVNKVVPILAGIFSLHGFICTGEGLLLGQRDLGYLGKSYGVYFFAVPYFMLRIKKLALSGASNVGLTSLWNVFFWYQVVRAAVWAVRIKILDGRAKFTDDDGGNVIGDVAAAPLP